MELNKKPARCVLASLLLLLSFNFAACTPTDGTTDETTTEDGSTSGNGGISTGNPSNPNIPNTTPTQYTEEVQTIAANSSCAAYSWTSRGKAPLSYIKGMALTYARSYCRLRQGQIMANVLSGAAGSSSTDALGLYASTFNGLGMDIYNPGTEPLRALYTLGIGLGMRESSGKYCEGRDMSASNTSASTAEAGMFQTSYDSMSASSHLSALYSEYKAHPEKCYLDIYRVGVSCTASSISGTGAGAEYQSFNKSCPAFAAEYAMIMLRVRRNHYGPINRQEAEVKTQCNQMLKSVQDMIDSDPYACDDLL